MDRNCQGGSVPTRAPNAEAIALNRRCLEIEPLNTVAYHNLGFPYLSAGRFTEAEETCRKILELSPAIRLTPTGGEA